MRKELKRIKANAEAQGFETEVTGDGHMIVRKDGRRVTTFSGTPSDNRSDLNAMAPLKRAGYKHTTETKGKRRKA